jgi:hypothetical protein
MNKKKIALLVSSVLVLAPVVTGLSLQKLISSKIAARVEREIPNASGVSVSIPITELPGDLTSDEIKSVKISIDNYFSTERKTNSSLSISAKNIRKAQPQVIGSLDVVATIPVSTMVESSEFNDAQIVGNALLVPVGAGGAGTARLVPRYRNNQIYFEIVSVSFLGNEIPASSLPDDLQNQVKSRSQRNLKVPEGMRVKSVALNSKGLSLNVAGSDVQLSGLRAGIEVES